MSSGAELNFCIWLHVLKLFKKRTKLCSLFDGKHVWSVVCFCVLIERRRKTPLCCCRKMTASRRALSNQVLMSPTGEIRHVFSAGTCTPPPTTSAIVSISNSLICLFLLYRHCYWLLSVTFLLFFSRSTSVEQSTSSSPLNLQTVLCL